MSKFRRRNKPFNNRKSILNAQLTSRTPLVKTNKLVSQYNPNGNNGNGKRAKGRPPSYKKEYAQQAYAACKNWGLTMEQLGELFGLKSDFAIYQWMDAYPEFNAGVKDGIDEWRSKAVEETLLQRALGYEYEEVTTSETRVAVTPPKGAKVWLPAVHIKRTIRHVQPSDVAIIFYLKNRKQDRWKDVREYEGRFSKREISLRLQAELKTEQLKGLGVEELEQLEYILSQIDAGDGAESVYDQAGSG